VAIYKGFEIWRR